MKMNAVSEVRKRLFHTLRKVLILSSLMGVMVGCAGGKMMHSMPTLYQRLGEKPAIEAVVDDFLARLGADTRITNEKVKARLAAIHLPGLRKHLVNLICNASGGPCQYAGRSMKDAHAGLKITSREFDITVEDLVATLDKFKVPASEKSEVLALLGPMRGDIVEVP